MELKATSSKRAYAIPRIPAPVGVHCWSVPPQETLRHSFVSVSVGVSGSWCPQGMFEPSEHLCRVCGLILNMILPLLPTCWSFSALGHGVSPHSCYSSMQQLLQHLFLTEEHVIDMPIDYRPSSVQEIFRTYLSYITETLYTLTNNSQLPPSLSSWQLPFCSPSMRLTVSDYSLKWYHIVFAPCLAYFS